MQGRITNKSGDLGEAFRKGEKQVFSWEEWLESNYSSLRESFIKYINPNEVLPENFFIYDKSRMHFVIIAGTRKDFNQKTYRIRRKYKEEKNILLLHYENLIDSGYEVLGSATY